MVIFIMKNNKSYLMNISKEIRLNILKEIFNKKKGHIGGCLSCVDLIVSIYFSNIFKLKKKNLKSKKRDRFILSKGHAALTLYAVLDKIGVSKNFKLSNFHKNGSLLLEHPSPSKKLPGIETETGSLGNGIGIGCGTAYAKKDLKVIILVGDGELYEGSNWEALMMAASYNLKNLLVIVDRNKLITLDKTENLIKLENLKKKFKAFNFNTSVINGHNFEEIKKKLLVFKKTKNNKPSCIIANTTKGKGIKFMENNKEFHHKIPNKLEYQKALELLN